MINVKNIYYMLAYAYEALNESATRTLATEPFEHIHDLFAAILSRGVAYQIKRGLHRSYIPNEDELHVIRGSIDITRTARANASQRAVVACRFDEFSEDDELNRILKSTMLLLLMNGKVKDESKRALRKALMYFGNVKNVPPTELQFSNIRYDRNNQTYRLIIAVCEMVHKGLLQSRQSGKTLLRDYLDDERMHDLYERFILNYYRHEHPELRPRAEHVAWNLDPGSDDEFLPIMRTDTTLTCGTRKLIIDAKFYYKALRNSQHSDKRGVISGHLYQIFAYVKNKDVKRDGSVSGILLYAKTDEEQSADGMDYMMSGNRIGIRTLALDGEWKGIVGALEGIVDEWRETCVQANRAEMRQRMNYGQISTILDYYQNVPSAGSDRQLRHYQGQSDYSMTIPRLGRALSNICDDCAPATFSRFAIWAADLNALIQDVSSAMSAGKAAEANDLLRILLVNVRAFGECCRLFDSQPEGMRFNSAKEILADIVIAMEQNAEHVNPEYEYTYRRIVETIREIEL